MPARIRLVATAGPLDGRGHLGRALSLAEALAERGTAAELQLLAGSMSPNEAARAAAASLAVVAVGEEAEAAPPGVAVVVDLPDPRIAPAVDPDRLLVMDDRDTFAGRAAVVVQAAQPSWNGPGSAGTVLAGYDYVPISAAVRRRRPAGLDAAVPALGRRVVMCFGGADPGNVTRRLVGVLADIDAEVEVIVGPSYRGSTDGWPVTAVRDPADLVERLAGADVVVLGAGTMKFDAACLGRPAILLAVADDQLVVGPAFASTGAARFLGDGRTIVPGVVARAVEGLLADPSARAALASRAREVVDVRGADRIAAVLERLAD
jgi:spore coat polysaccharide biosynthesis predicted glycosyltransferase SpsG